ncbi:hypothetical protein [uncultured Draconibacterium sp.]|uniref:hypothetical protein n=1 Tax=uncultured Draconibacterium sp. TaxID=1573823 RepID=UPI0029C7F6D6|nr:hypothetical protein [uncultured Draconibacterium sp.]
MKRIFIGILFLTFFALPNSSVNAQDTPPKTKYMVWEVQVNPLQQEKLLHAIASQNAFLKEQNYPYANITQYTNEGYLWYSIPFTNYADIDKIEAASQKLWKEHSAKSKELQKLFDDAFNSIGGFILEYQPELSIRAEERDIPANGKRFRFFEKFYIKFGKEKEFEDLIKRYKELRETNGFKDDFITLYPAFAHEMNVVYFIDETGSNAAEHFSDIEKHWEIFGKDGEELWNDVKQLIVKIETRTGLIDYDVSYFPKE